MKLPKLYRAIEIEFSSLRNGIGSGYGVILDIDTLVTRNLMRVADARYSCGWSWVIAERWDDGFFAVDLECLNDCEGPEDTAYMRYVNRIVAMRMHGITEQDIHDTMPPDRPVS